MILLQDVAHLGARSDVKNVRDGFARNFLFPRGLAKRATPAALALLAEEQKQGAHRAAAADAAHRAAARDLASRVVHLYAKAGENDRLFGSVTPGEIKDALAREHQIVVEEDWITIQAPIKTLGQHSAMIAFPHGVAASLTLMVEKEKE